MCCQLVKNYICDETNHNSFGLVLTALHEVCKHKYYILDNIILFLTDGFMIPQLVAL